MQNTRRAFLRSGLAIAGTALLGPAAPAASSLDRLRVRTPLPVRAEPVAAAATSPRLVRPELLERALAALDRHARVRKRDRIAIADFDAPSSQPRFHVIDLVGGTSTSLLVAHGSGSDPDHSGFVERFSNAYGSNASSDGAFLTDDYYVGKHGRSQRLVGLDPSNDNALGRAIVVHGAWYADAGMLATHGKLGRSQGCFAVGDGDLDQVFAHLGSGRMIYAAKV